MNGFVEAKDFAKRLNISIRTFDRMVKAGQIPQPLPRLTGGKRVWYESVVSKTVGGEAA